MLVHSIDFHYFEDHWVFLFSSASGTQSFRIAAKKADYPELSTAVTHAINLVERDVSKKPRKGLGSIQPGVGSLDAIEWIK